MSAKYSLSGKITKCTHGTLPSLRKDADKFYSYHAGGQSAHGDDPIRRNKGENYLSCVNEYYIV